MGLPSHLNIEIPYNKKARENVSNHLPWLAAYIFKTSVCWLGYNFHLVKINLSLLVMRSLYTSSLCTMWISRISLNSSSVEMVGFSFFSFLHSSDMDVFQYFSIKGNLHLSRLNYRRWENLVDPHLYPWEQPHGRQFI